MNSRTAHQDLEHLYGPGLSQMLSDEVRGNNIASVPAEQDDYPVMALKKRKQSTLLKEILKNGGFSDLAKMVSIHKSS